MWTTFAAKDYALRPYIFQDDTLPAEAKNLLTIDCFRLLFTIDTACYKYGLQKAGRDASFFPVIPFLTNYHACHLHEIIRVPGVVGLPLEFRASGYHPLSLHERTAIQAAGTHNFDTALADMVLNAGLLGLVGAAPVPLLGGAAVLGVPG